MRLSPGIALCTGLVLVVVGANVAACATLEAIESGTCGNRVLEQDEDCDSVAPPSRFKAGEHGACGAPGSGAGACRFLCGQRVAGGGTETSVCPIDEVC